MRFPEPAQRHTLHNGEYGPLPAQITPLKLLRQLRQWSATGSACPVALSWSRPNDQIDIDFVHIRFLGVTF